MNHTERQLAEFRDKFAKLKRRHKQATAVAGAAWLLLVISLMLGEDDALGVPAMMVVIPFAVIFVGAGMYALIAWKCPACRTRLAQEKVRFCHYCGVRLVE